MRDVWDRSKKKREMKKYKIFPEEFIIGKPITRDEKGAITRRN